MYYYSKTKTYRTRMIIFMVLCALTINIMLPLSASASGLQPIMGETIANKEDMVEYYEKESPISYPGEYLKQDVNLDKFIDIIISEAETEEIRADVVFAQILVETEWLKFDNGVSILKNNFGGLKDLEGNYFAFDSIEEGIRANVQMLKEYSSEKPLNQEKIDLLNEIKIPQEKITYVDNLGNGTWSEESEYGENIRRYLNEMANASDIILSEEESEKQFKTISQTDLGEPLETTSHTELENPLEIQQEDIVSTEEFKSHEESIERETKESQQDINQVENIIDSENQTKENMPTNDAEQSIEESSLFQQVEVKTLTIDGPGYVGGSHRIRSYGTSSNGVLYQFWIKDLSTNTWTMIQDYSKSSAHWTPTKAGKYLYGVHIKDEQSNERLDTYLYKEITIVEAPVEAKTLTIDGPGYVGENHRIRSYGTSRNGILYQFWIKDLSTNTWTMIQDYSKSSASWTPTKPGKYLYGVHIKDEKSNTRLDAHLYKEIIIEETSVVPVEVKTLTIDGSGYVGGSHRIRSYGTSRNGVLYQFWIKDLSTNTWTMIQDYSKSSAPWTPTKAGKYLYGVHIKDEQSNERLDAYLYKEIKIESAEVKTLTIDGPAYVGGNHRIRSYGESANGVLYQFWVKDLNTNTWTMIQDYSKSSASWIPTKAGKYLYGVHIKDEQSNERLDAHLYKEITIEPAIVKSLNIEGSSYAGYTHSIRSYGESANGVLYQFWIKDLSANTWTMIQDYSKGNSAKWTPIVPGNYLYGVHIKDTRSNAKLDEYIYKDITIEHIVDKALDSYKKAGIDYRPRTQEYDICGDYLNYGTTNSYSESSKLIFDDDGIPKVKYEDGFFYNPVVVAQYALTKHGQYLNTGEDIDKVGFLTAVDKLVEIQDEMGAFRYDFYWKYYLTGEVYEPGWVSGMAQGQALNALSRAYYISGDNKYLKSGNKAIEFLITEVEEGGTKSNLGDLDPSLDDYIIFEEYISVPDNYTLNGFMFTLLGLYDWKIITNEYQPDIENLAEEYFESGIKTLEIILPYYDMGGFSSYDLGHLTFNKEPHINVTYHAVHIYLLHALDSVESNEILKGYEELWRSYVDDL